MPNGWKTDIIEFVDDDVLVIDAVADLVKHKKVRQNLFYTTEGAETFYTYRGSDLEEFHRLRVPCRLGVTRPLGSGAERVSAGLPRRGAGEQGEENQACEGAAHGDSWRAGHGPESPEARLALVVRTPSKPPQERLHSLRRLVTPCDA